MRASVRACVRACVGVHLCVHLCVHVCVRACMRVYVGPFVRACVRACVRVTFRRCCRPFSHVALARSIAAASSASFFAMTCLRSAESPAPTGTHTRTRAICARLPMDDERLPVVRIALVRARVLRQHKLRVVEHILGLLLLPNATQTPQNAANGGIAARRVPAPGRGSPQPTSAPGLGSPPRWTPPPSRSRPPPPLPPPHRRRRRPARRIPAGAREASVSGLSESGLRLEAYGVRFTVQRSGVPKLAPGFTP